MALSVTCTQIACPVYAAAYWEKIPDKTAISGCELDEGNATSKYFMCTWWNSIKALSADPLGKIQD